MNTYDQIIALLQGELTQDAKVSKLLQTLSSSPEYRILFLDQIVLMNKYDRMVENTMPGIIPMQTVWNRIDQYEQGIKPNPTSSKKGGAYFSISAVSAYIASMMVGFCIGWLLSNFQTDSNQSFPIGQESPNSKFIDSITTSQLKEDREQSNIQHKRDPLRSIQPLKASSTSDSSMSYGSMEDNKEGALKSVSVPINLVFPNGGEVLSQNSKIPLIWNNDDREIPIAIDFSSDGGSNWTSIVSDSVTDKYYWTIPNEIQTSTTFLCKVSQHGQSEAQLSKTFNGVKGGNAIAISPDGHFLAAGEGGENPQIILWDLRTNQQVQKLTGHRNSVILLKFNQDGSKLISGSIDSTAILWNVLQGTKELVLQSKHGRIWPAVFSPDNSTIATGNDDGTVTLWRANDGTEIDTFSPHSQGVRYLEYSSDGTRLLATSVDGMASIIDAFTGEVLQYFQHRLDSVAYSEYANATTREERINALQRNIVNGMQLSNDESVAITSGYDGVVKFWETSTGKLIRSKIYHNNEKGSELLISPDGKWMASIGYDGSTKIIDPLTGAVALEIKIDSLPMIRSAFTPDSQFIGITHSDGRVTLWKLPLNNIDISDSFFTIKRCEDSTIK